ncbi:hypothetical protein Tco_1407382 [Tanacetum coccineum]
MLAICAADTPMVFKALKTSSKSESVSQGTKPGANLDTRSFLLLRNNLLCPAKRQQKVGPLKHLPVPNLAILRKEKSPARPWTQTQTSPPHTPSPPFQLVYTLCRYWECIKRSIKQWEAQPLLGTCEAKSLPSVNCVIADPLGKSACCLVILYLNNCGMNEGTPKNTSYDNLFAGKGASSIARQVKEDEALTQFICMMMRLWYHTTTEDTSVPKSLSLRSSQIQELTNQVLILQSQKHKLEIKKNKVEAKVALLNAQPSFPNVGHLNELLVKSLQTEFSKILSTHDFSSSLPTKLKDLSSKFNELTEEVKGLKQQVHELEIELLGYLKEIPSKLEDFTKTVTSLTSQVDELKTLQWELLAEFVSLPVQVASVQAKLKTLDALPGLLLKVTKALNKFTQVLDSASSKVRD